MSHHGDCVDVVKPRNAVDCTCDPHKDDGDLKGQVQINVSIFSIY